MWDFLDDLLDKAKAVTDTVLDATEPIPSLAGDLQEMIEELLD